MSLMSTQSVVYRLPIRDGNSICQNFALDLGCVYRLPIRDGNRVGAVRIIAAEIVYRLPIRDGNLSEWS